VFTLSGVFKSRKIALEVKNSFKSRKNSFGSRKNSLPCNWAEISASIAALSRSAELIIWKRIEAASSGFFNPRCRPTTTTIKQIEGFKCVPASDALWPSETSGLRSRNNSTAVRMIRLWFQKLFQQIYIFFLPYLRPHRLETCNYSKKKPYDKDYFKKIWIAISSGLTPRKKWGNRNRPSQIFNVYWITRNRGPSFARHIQRATQDVQ